MNLIAPMGMGWVDQKLKSKFRNSEHLKTRKKRTPEKKNSNPGKRNPEKKTQTPIIIPPLFFF